MPLDPNLLIAMPLLCLTPLAIVLLVLRHRRNLAELKQKTILELVGRGAALPPDLWADAAAKTPHDDLRRGLVLAFTGLGAIVFAFTLPSHQAWGLGLVPLFTGFGYLISWRLAERSESLTNRA
jgi:hypothetical protein